MSAVLSPRPLRLRPDDWAWFGDFWFDASEAQIQPADQEKITAIVTVLRGQPTRRVAIEGAARDRDGDLGAQRIAGLRQALLRAGIGADRIVAGELGRSGLRHAQRVEVLIGPP